MDEITLDDKKYVSSKQAAKITGYAKDYVGQLCREGRVEARLVGRNWYVLESSIRDHRFGSEDKTHKQTENLSNLQENKGIEDKISAWTPASYTSETTSEEIPLVAAYKQPASINMLDGRDPVFPIEPEIEEVSSNVVKEMQSAWHDWFVKTNELSVSEEILLENNSEIVSTDSDFIPETDYEPETTPITLEKVSEVIDEIVPIHRTFTAPVQPVAESSNAQQRTTFSRGLGANREIPSHMYQPIPSEGRILHERRVIRRKKPSLVLKTIFILIGFGVMGVTLISSGLFDSILSKYEVGTSPVNYLVGQSSFTK